MVTDGRLVRVRPSAERGDERIWHSHGWRARLCASPRWRGGTSALPFRVEDLESGSRLPIAARQFQQQYRQLVQAHQAELQRMLGANQVDYIFTDTSQPLDQVLYRYLSDRARQNRVRR